MSFTRQIIHRRQEGKEEGKTDNFIRPIIILSLFLIMEVIREHFERAWRGVISPNQYKYHISSLLNAQ